MAISFSRVPKEEGAKIEEKTGVFFILIIWQYSQVLYCENEINICKGQERDKQKIFSLCPLFFTPALYIVYLHYVLNELRLMSRSTSQPERATFSSQQNS